MCVASFEKTVGKGLGNFPKRGICITYAMLASLNFIDYRAGAWHASVLNSVPSMALILLVKVQSRVFTAKCSEPQVGSSNGMDEGSGVAKFLSLRTET